MEQLKNLAKLRPEAQRVLEPYLRRLLAIAGEDIISVLAFGSATGPDFVPGSSNINVAVIVRNLEPALLKKCLGHVAGGFKKRIVAPLFLTRQYIQSSLDVFPIEFLDIRETGVVLVGEDPLANVDLNRSSLRLECEQQLKKALLRTRQAYLELGTTRRGLETVLSDSLNSLIPVLRALLVLGGASPPRGKKETVGSACEALGVDPRVFNEVLRLRLEKTRLTPERKEQILGEYMNGIEKLAHAADVFHVEEKR